MKIITSNQFVFELGRYLIQAQQEEIVILLENGQLVRLTGLRQEDLTDVALSNVQRLTGFIQQFESSHDIDVTQDPLYYMGDYDFEAPADLSVNHDKYLYGDD
jgi:hypothetical protein